MTPSNENGSILVIALIMLALLTTLGIMSTNTTSIDLQIARNERIQKENFNFAEAAAMEAAQRVVDDGATGKNYTTAPFNTWITKCDETDTTSPCAYPYRDTAYWTGGGASEVKTSSVDGDGNTFYTVQYNGEFSGSSLGLGSSTIRLDKFTCYGLYKDASRGEVLIEVALTKATS